MLADYTSEHFDAANYLATASTRDKDIFLRMLLFELYLGTPTDNTIRIVQESLSFLHNYYIRAENRKHANDAIQRFEREHKTEVPRES